MDNRERSFFRNCQNVDDVKKEYRRLAKIYHPDRGGNTPTMQAINAEYEIALEQAKSMETVRVNYGMGTSSQMKTNAKREEETVNVEQKNKPVTNYIIISVLILVSAVFLLTICMPSEGEIVIGFRNMNREPVHGGDVIATLIGYLFIGFISVCLLFAYFAVLVVVPISLIASCFQKKEQSKKRKAQDFPGFEVGFFVALCCAVAVIVINYLLFALGISDSIFVISEVV